MKSHSPNKVLYFDYNATHPPFPEILKEKLDEYLEDFYNPSGSTRYSLKNQGKIEKARKEISKIVLKPESDLVFSSTGTEANYLLIQALRHSFPNLESILVSPFEHSSMYDAIRNFEFQMEILKTDKSGLVDLEDLNTKLKTQARPIICLMAGNETGVIQPVEEISKLARFYEQFFLSDLMQAVGKIQVNFALFDGFSFSGHKLGAGMGTAVTGFTNFPKNTQIFGGGNQENSHRGGTENVFSILSLPSALQFALTQLEEKNVRLSSFQKKLEHELEDLGCEIIAKNSPRLPNTSFIKLPVSNLDFLLLGLEEKGIILSTGSSCKSRAREASPSLLRMGYSEDEALLCVRISTGIFTIESEIKFLISELKELIFSFSDL